MWQRGRGEGYGYSLSIAFTGMIEYSLLFFTWCSFLRTAKQKVKMNDVVNVFEVDQASYSSLKAVEEALDPEVTERIKPVSSLIGMFNADTSIASHNGLVNNCVFMVII